MDHHFNLCNLFFSVNALTSTPGIYLGTEFFQYYNISGLLHIATNHVFILDDIASNTHYLIKHKFDMIAPQFYKYIIYELSFHNGLNPLDLINHINSCGGPCRPVTSITVYQVQYYSDPFDHYLLYQNIHNTLLSSYEFDYMNGMSLNAFKTTVIEDLARCSIHNTLLHGNCIDVHGNCINTIEWTSAHFSVLSSDLAFFNHHLITTNFDSIANGLGSDLPNTVNTGISTSSNSSNNSVSLSKITNISIMDLPNMDNTSITTSGNPNIGRIDLFDINNISIMDLPNMDNTGITTSSNSSIISSSSNSIIASNNSTIINVDSSNINNNAITTNSTSIISSSDLNNMK